MWIDVYVSVFLLATAAFFLGAAVAAHIMIKRGERMTRRDPGFHCPDCYADCHEAQQVGSSEVDGRVYRCPECDSVFVEADALSDAGCKRDAEERRADHYHNDSDPLPF